MGSCPDTDIDLRICLTIKAFKLVINFFYLHDRNE